MSDNGDITRLLQQIGEQRADLNALMPLVYDELSAIAHRALCRERDGHTLSTGALVNEAYLKLAQQDRAQWRNRNHFLSVASLLMRRILVNHAEARLAAKRGGGILNEDLDNVDVAALDEAQHLVDLNGLLDRLATFDARAARIVECRYFTGMSVEETAEALKLSPATVKRVWNATRAWLRRELESAR